MKQTDFRDVPDEMWEGMIPFLPRSSEKGVAVARPFRNVRSLLESSTNAVVDANGPCFLPALAQKVQSISSSNAGAKPVSWRRSFASFLLNVGKVGVDAQWQAMDGTLLQGRALKQRLRASDATDEQRAKWWQDSSPCGIRVFLWE